MLINVLEGGKKGFAKEKARQHKIENSSCCHGRQVTQQVAMPTQKSTCLLC
jgi:hypothetical protein